MTTRSSASSRSRPITTIPAGGKDAPTASSTSTRAKWAELPKLYQDMVTIAAAQVAADLTAKYDARNAPAIKRLVAAGAQIAAVLDRHPRRVASRRPTSCLPRSRQRTQNSRRCTNSMIAFRNEQYQWHQVCEATYDNYMIRRSPRLSADHRGLELDIRTGRPVTLAPNGMVTSPHSLASAAGVDVLRAGGSAIDAAIATSAVLAVVYPHMTGLGGDAFWLIHDGASGEVRYLNGGGKAAAGATLSRFESARPERNPASRASCPATLTVPGAVASWIEAHAAYGRLPLRRVLESAIGYARDGFPVTGAACELHRDDAR